MLIRVKQNAWNEEPPDNFDPDATKFLVELNIATTN